MGHGSPSPRGQRQLVTGAGIQLVTVWQSKAQLDTTYGKDAETVLTNHRSRLIYPSGITDLATVSYISELVGDEHVRSDLDEQRWLATSARPSPDRTPAAAIPLLPSSVLRRVAVGDALLVHGNLPPAWLHLPRSAPIAGRQTPSNARR